MEMHPHPFKVSSGPDRKHVTCFCFTRVFLLVYVYVYTCVCMFIIIVVLWAHMVHKKSKKSILYHVGQMNQLYHLTFELAPQIFSTQGTCGRIDFDWWR